ncbi:TonB-dependent siderophore receptor [Pelistega ratti]|uniref:TonB-dependent siderophore receptor n=1 Tax=Pelistega ratti TaxID=2652177 RepID=UPI001358369A|nr:TonB-dependent siderophore receptor [Pelistega ratti]
MQQFKLTLISSTLLLAFSSPAFAETLTDNDELDQIDVTSGELKQLGYHAIGTSAVSKVDVPIIDTPTTVNVVTSQLIQDRRPNNLVDALATVSGVSEANTLGGIFDAVQKRGFGGNRDNSIMRNGMQAGPSHNFGATTETVEVLKGPASVLYGIQDPGGVINVVTKKPLNTPKYALSVGSGNHSAWGTQLDFTGPLGNGFAYRFIYDKQDKDYWRNFGRIKSTTYAPSLSWENNKTKILMAYEHLDYEQPFDRGTALVVSDGGRKPNIPISRRLDEPNNQTIGKVDNFQLKIEHQLNDEWKINAAYGYVRDEYSYYQTRVQDINTSYTDNKLFSDRISLPPRTALRRMEQQAAKQTVHSASLNLVGEFAIGNIANRFIIGADASRNYRDTGPVYNNGGTSRLNIDNPIYTNPPLRRGANLIAANNWQINHIKTLGLYIQDTAYLTDKLIVTGGVRYEYFDQVAGRHAIGAAFRPNVDQSDGKFLYQLGTVYKFTPQWAVYANYAESFRPQAEIAAYTDAGLPPEKGKSFEVGTKYESTNINATLAFFNINKHNVSDTISINGNSEVVIAGKQRSRGIEVDINGYITDKLSAALTYTYTDVKSLSHRYKPATVGKQLNGVPKHQGALYLSYDIGTVGPGQLRIGGGIKYLGSWNAYNSTYTNVYKIPSAVIGDAFASYETKITGKKVDFQFNVKNLTDKTYYQSTSGVADNRIIPVSIGYGREFFLNAKVEF